MSKALYRVKFELLEMDDGKKDAAEWRLQDPVTVLADNDARSAVAKLEKKVLPPGPAGSFTWDDDDGTKHETKNIGFRLVGVEHLHDVDYP